MTALSPLSGRAAFEVAAFDQGAHVTFLGPDGTHIGREESIADTAQVLGRMYDGIEFRGYDQATVDEFARHAGVPVWNGLTDQWHPTQMLADVLTMTDGRPGPIEAVSCCFLGDGRGNIARSLLVTGALLGMDVRIAAPEELQPPADVRSLAERLAAASGARLTITADPLEGVRDAAHLYTDVWVSMGEAEQEWAHRIPLLTPYRVTPALMAATGRPDTRSCTACRPSTTLAPVVAGNHVILCHGNGPQIGLLAVESGNDAELTSPFPLDTLGAQTQGLIGYWLAQELANAGVRAAIAVVLTQTLVSPADPAFARPTKFIGATYSRAEAAGLAAGRGWQLAADTAGWRRVVASPEPCAVVELPLIEQLTGAGHVVICAGGGGVPVIRTGDGLLGTEAVVDKDLTAALLAVELHADRFVVLTDTDAVKVGFGTATEAALDTVYVDELDGMSFPAGSMGPKIAACSRFVTRTGRSAHIGALDHAADVVAGRSGTTIRAHAVPVR